MDLVTIFMSELVGTGILILLGGGSVAANLLSKSKGHGAGFLFVNFGWGLAVMMGVLVSAPSGGHLNPAVTIGLLLSGADLSFAQVIAYIAGQMIGAMIGALFCWLAYKQHFDVEENPSLKLAVFSTAPEIRNPLWNVITEVIGTFVLVFVVIGAGRYTDFHAETSGLGGPANLGWLGALGVGLLVVVIGIGLGGPTGYAINPARDLGPRIMHALLPIKGKGHSDWSYSWVPVVGPLLGGAIAGLASGFLLV